jgi:hypothetical protein
MPATENPTIEKSEEKQNPEARAEKAVSDAVEALESEDKKDPIISSGWAEGAKKFWKDEEGGINLDSAKTVGKYAGCALAIGAFISYKVLRGAYELAKKSIQKKGQIGFGDGYEIGKEMLTFTNKKDKT